MAMDGMQGPVGIVGMGRTGQSVAKFLRARGVECIGFDEAPRSAPGVRMIVGPLAQADFSACRQLIVSPGIDWRHPALERARRDGLPVGGDLDVFCAHYQGELLAVTGTNGKTTTVTLIQTLLDTLPGGIEAAGNIGRPMLELLDLPQQPRRVVLELSSFQLERSSRLRAHWAALLNLQPDHADMHRDMAAYEAAKCRLFARQQAGDRALLPLDAHWDELAQALARRGVQVTRFGACDADGPACAGIEPAERGWSVFWTHDGVRQRVHADEIRVRGRHQHLNLAVAAQAAADHGVADGVIREGLTSFRGLPHRLQWIGHAQGRDWYDDSKATNPDAAMAALGCFERVLWICGGLCKGLTLERMRETVARHVVRAYVIGRDPAPFQALLRAAGVPFECVGDLGQAVAMAAHHGECLPVVLSPAAASQDQFRDYAERGRTFVAAVRALEEKP